MAGAFTDEDKIVKEALRLIDQGWKQLSSQAAPKRNVIFVLGGTGAGKSTAVQIITGNLKDLTSKPGRHGSGLVIVDEPVGNTGEGRIGDPRVASKTFLPEYLVCEDDPSLVFVDCPGFNDNRGTHMDIAAMVLIKKIAEQVDHARFLFVTPSSSVSYSNINRNDFSLLCTHATSFIKNLEKVKDSISLIVTKVNNCDPSTGEPTQDLMVIEETSNFLNEVAGQGSTKIENRQFIENLLYSKGNWALIRFPNKPGPLSELQHFVGVRRTIQEMCGRLKRARLTPEDFAITLAYDSKYIITKRLVPHMKAEIDKLVKCEFKSLEFEFQIKFRKNVEKQEVNVLVSVIQNLGAICDKFKEIGKVAERYRQIRNKLKLISGWLHVELDTNAMNELSKLEEQLRLFQQVTEEEDGQESVTLTQALNGLRTNLEDLHKCALKTIKDTTIRKVESQIKDEGVRILEFVEKQYALAFWESLEIGDGYGRNTLIKLERDWSKYELMNDMMTEKISDDFQKICHDLSIPIMDCMEELIRLEEDLECLLELTGLAGRATQLNVVSEIRKIIYNLRQQAKDRVKDKFVKSVHERIQNNVDRVAVHLEETFLHGIFYPDLNLTTLEEKVRLLSNVFAKIQISGWTSNEILEVIKAVRTALGVEISKDETDLAELIGVLNFYDEVLGTVAPRPVELWLKGLKEIEGRLRDIKIFYEYVEHSKGISPNTVDEDILCAEGTENLTDHILEVLRAPPDVLRIVRERAEERDKLLLVELAKFIQTGRTTLNNDGQRLIVKGREVRFSEFVNDSGMPRYNTKILVMASEKVTIDKDINAPGMEVTVTVIANKWEVKGPRKIHLEGVDGIPHTNIKASSGKSYGESGEPGLPGNCGTNGGHFIGVYSTLTNGQNLAVYVDGGNGGPGQAGGDGREGKRGRDAVPADLQAPTLGPVGNWFGRFGTRVASTVLPNLKVLGKPGGKGGAGGDGGAGGIQGLAGTIQLIPVGTPVKIGAVSNRHGSTGQPGDGGIGGRGGKNGNDIEFTSLTRYIVSGDDVAMDSRWGAPGRNGNPGSNTSGQVVPPPQSNTQLEWRDIQAFRRYLKEDCHGQRTGGHRLLELMDKHPDIPRPPKW